MEQKNDSLFFAVVKKRVDRTDVVIDGIEFQITAVHHERSPIERINRKYKHLVVRVLRITDTKDVRGYHYEFDSFPDDTK